MDQERKPPFTKPLASTDVSTGWPSELSDQNYICDTKIRRSLIYASIFKVCRKAFSILSSVIKIFVTLMNSFSTFFKKAENLWRYFPPQEEEEEEGIKRVITPSPY